MRGSGRSAGLVGAVVLAACLGGAAGAQSPSPVASPGAPAGVLDVTLAATYAAGDADLELRRTTLQPGARLEGIAQPGTAISRVESGTIIVTAVDGEVVAFGAQLAPGETQPVPAGQSVATRPGSVMTWENPGTEPAVILTARILDAPWGRPADPGADPFADAVQHRFVVLGPESGGTRGRYTIKDRSGKVIGARLPTERELRFWSPVGDGAGPLTDLRPGLSELMVSWSGGVCGPVVTFDVAADLRTIRIDDRSPGCDAAAVGHWLVLQLHSGWFDPATIRVD